MDSLGSNLQDLFSEEEMLHFVDAAAEGRGSVSAWCKIHLSKQLFIIVTYAVA